MSKIRIIMIDETNGELLFNEVAEQDNLNYEMNNHLVPVEVLGIYDKEHVSRGFDISIKAKFPNESYLNDLHRAVDKLSGRG